MDATHPQHNPVLGSGWIKRERYFSLKSKTDGRRLNINGVIEAETQHARDKTFKRVRYALAQEYTNHVDRDSSC